MDKIEQAIRLLRDVHENDLTRFHLNYSSLKKNIRNVRWDCAEKIRKAISILESEPEPADEGCTNCKNRLEAEIDRLTAENKAKDERIKELQEYIHKNSGHHPSCGRIHGSAYACVCGFEQALEGKTMDAGCRTQDETPEAEMLRDMEVLKLGPGDVIVLKSQDFMSDHVQENLRKLIEKEFPGHKCILLDGGMEIGVVATEGTEKNG